MKRIALGILYVLSIGLANAQSLTPSVIASAGDSFSSSTGSLVWTLGEIVTETFVQSSGSLTQGFQQSVPNATTGLEEMPLPTVVYPNPSKDLLIIQLSEPGPYRLQVFDIQGKKIMEDQVTVQEERQEILIHLRDFQNSLYVIRVESLPSGRNSIHKIIKY